MKRIIRLTESDLTRIVRRVITEGTEKKWDILRESIPQEEKIAVIQEALNLYNDGKTADLDPELKMELDTIKKYTIEARPDYAAWVFEQFVAKNPLYKFIKSNRGY